MAATLQQCIKNIIHQWTEGPPRTLNSSYKPFLRCRSDPDAPPPYWENDPNLSVIRYGSRIHMEEKFCCKDGVNVAQLLMLSRKTLFEVACNNGANVLLNERWDCSIAKSTVRHQEHYKVQISYSATTAKATGKDPQKVARVEDARRIGGLMTILARR